MSTDQIIRGRKTVGEVAIETRALVDLLSAMKIGALVTYGDLSKACGANVQTVARSRLDSARRIAMREAGVVFDVVKNIGLLRIANKDVVKTAERRRRHIERQSRAELARQATVDPRKLDAVNRAEHTAVVIQTTYIYATSKRKFLKRAMTLAMQNKTTPGDIESLLRPARLLPIIRKKKKNEDEDK